jgi:putative aldouronate transport system substrate-binding protein
MKLEKKLVLLILPLAILAAGCSKSSGTAAAVSGGDTGGVASYPLKTDVTLTWWADYNNNVSPNYANLGDTPFGKGLQERTGVKITFLHPPAGGADEQFNLLVASNDLPDILERPWLNYPGGPEKAISDGVILKLNDTMDKYAPYLTAVLKGNADYDRAVKTDNGSYFAFPFIRGHTALLTSRGLMIRQDWLNELGLQMPTTIDEWHTVLTAFKTQKGVQSPFSFEYGSLNDVLGFALAYNAPPGWFIGDDGKVHFGPIENGRRDYLSTFSRWYKEGLVDQDVATLQMEQVAAKMTSGRAGSSMGWMGSRLGVWTNAARPTNPSFTLAPAPFPVVNKGDSPKMGSTELPFSNSGSCAITASSKNITLAARVLDWAYGDEGHMFYNFGIEGESYNMVNGYPAYTDWILKNPSGWPIAQSLGAYVRSVYNGPFVQDLRYFEQYMVLPEQQNAIKVWTIEGSLKYTLPAITPTPDESREFAQIMNEINTYRSEMELKFILGTENLSSWDNYTSTIKRMGIDRAIAIQEAALARYNAR